MNRYILFQRKETITTVFFSFPFLLTDVILRIVFVSERVCFSIHNVFIFMEHNHFLILKFIKIKVKAAKMWFQFQGETLFCFGEFGVWIWSPI